MTAPDCWTIELAGDHSHAVVGHPGRDYLWILSRNPAMLEATSRDLHSRRKELPMPHVVIEQAVDLPVASQGIKLTAVRSGGEILKIVDVFLNRSGHTALVDCVVVEEGRSQSFFVQLSQKDRQITVRLLPATDPEKTVGVKRIMGLIARQVHESVGGSRFGKTNLQEFLNP